jgi:prephenate dehydratase
MSVRFLGSFPKADGIASVVQTGNEDADFAQAQRWLDEVRDGRAG